MEEQAQVFGYEENALKQAIAMQNLAVARQAHGLQPLQVPTLLDSTRREIDDLERALARKRRIVQLLEKGAEFEELASLVRGF